MKQYLFIIAFSLFTSIGTFAQHSVQGLVIDSKSESPIELGAVRLLNSKDSSLIQGTQTDLKGNFIIKKVTSGNYILSVSMIGYSTYYQNIVVAKSDLILKTIHIKETSHQLAGVVVSGNLAQLVVKGDTTEFNANAFKTVQNANVEDLLKRLPGVEVGSDGKITVNGQQISKIRVNGQKFFEGDVTMATKNIPADAISKIQVFDQKSDMAKLTGFEDNDTEHIINLSFKPNRLKGTFGNVSGGLGLDLNKDIRYDGNVFLSLMDGNTQSYIIAGANNANTSRSMGASAMTAMPSMAGMGGMSGLSMMALPGGFGGASSGITATQNVGYNQSSIINDKLRIGGFGSFNHSSTNAITNTSKESFLSGSTFDNVSDSKSINETYSANARVEIEYKPDSTNTILFQPNINYSRTLTNSESDYTNSTNLNKTSWGNTNSNGSGSSISGSLGVIYSHKFNSKRGRTLTANLQTSLSQNNNESLNYSLTNVIANSTTIDQRTLNNSNANSVNLRMSYVEPLWNLKNFLETTVSFMNSNSFSDKNQYNKDSQGNYTKIDSVYSNSFTNNFYNETLELNYQHIDKDYTFMLGVTGNPSQTHSYTKYYNGLDNVTDNNVLNFSPTARFQYNMGRRKFIRIDYRGQTTQPSVTQLQPVKNNSNAMNISIGNPDLNPSFRNSLQLIYSSFNDSTFASFNAFVSGQLTKDAFVTNSLYDTTGKQYSQTVNSPQSPYNITGNLMFNIPLVQKRLHFNTSTSGGYNQYYGYSARGLNANALNSETIPLGTLSSTRRINGSEMISLTFITDIIEIGARGSFSYSNTLNNLNPGEQITKDWSGGGNVMLHLPYNINIGSDINYTTQQGYSSSAQNQLIWNGSIDKTVFNNLGVVALKVVDILHQQKNLVQTVGDNYIQYSTYNTLPTYFLLSFTLKINKFKGADANPAANFMKFFPGAPTTKPANGTSTGTSTPPAPPAGAPFRMGF